MTPLEIALVILVSIWSLIFIIMAIALLLAIRELKKVFDKVNSILESGQEMADGVGAVSKMAVTGMAGLFNSRAKEEVRKIASKVIARSSSRK